MSLCVKWGPCKEVTVPWGPPDSSEQNRAQSALQQSSHRCLLHPPASALPASDQQRSDGGSTAFGTKYTNALARFPCLSLVCPVCPSKFLCFCLSLYFFKDLNTFYLKRKHSITTKLTESSPSCIPALCPALWESSCHCFPALCSPRSPHLPGSLAPPVRCILFSRTLFTLAESFLTLRPMLPSQRT